MTIQFGSIYVIVNLITWDEYIGQTNKKNPLYRIREHLALAMKKKHHNKFYNAIRKYGPENFAIYFLHEKNVHVDDLDEMEMHYIFDMDTYRNGYNSTPGGSGGRLCEEALAKITGENHYSRRDPQKKENHRRAISGDNHSLRNPESWKRHNDAINAPGVQERRSAWMKGSGNPMADPEVRRRSRQNRIKRERERSEKQGQTSFI